MHQLSHYQQAIIDAVVGTRDNLLIQAYAGCAKSTTLEYAAKALPGVVGIACAFNSHIVKDLTPKMPSNFQVRTMHSIGNEAVRNDNMGMRVEVDKYKVEKLFQEMFASRDRDSKNRYFKWKGSVSKIISLFKAQGMIAIKRLDNATTTQCRDYAEELIGLYDIKMPKLKHFEEEFYWRYLHQTWEAGLRTKSVIDFDDMIFFPVLFNMSLPSPDIMMIDEVQDLNPVQMDFAMNFGCRVIAVGDEKQAIYGFRGADVQAMRNFGKRLNAREMPLSVCYRCPQVVIREAQKLVPGIEPAPGKEEGVMADLKIDEYRKLIQYGDYALCRCTAPLVSECFAMIREGRKAQVKGRDIGEALETLIDQIATSDSQSTESFNYSLQQYRSKEIEKLSRAGRDDMIIAVEDKCETLTVILEACPTVAGMKQRIKAIFSDDVGQGITYCTVHKSKGLEANRIFLIEPELMPHPSAKLDWQREQEMNIKYVAITRAKKELYWVRGKVGVGVKSKVTDGADEVKPDPEPEIPAVTVSGELPEHESEDEEYEFTT